MAYRNYYRIKITREDDFVYFEDRYYNNQLRAIEDAKGLSVSDEYKEVEVIKYVPELLKKVKEKKQYHVLWGLVNKKYYVWSNKFIPFHANVFIKTFESKEEAQNHAEELNKFVEGEQNERF